MRKTKWSVTFAVVFALGGVAATQVAPVWADSSQSSGSQGDSHESTSGAEHDNDDSHSHSNASSVDFGPCVTAMKATANSSSSSGEHGQSGDDHGNDASHSSSSNDEHHGSSNSQVAGTTDTPCTNRGLSNERRVAWKEIKL